LLIYGFLHFTAEPTDSRQTALPASIGAEYKKQKFCQPIPNHFKMRKTTQLFTALLLASLFSQIAAQSK